MPVKWKVAPSLETLRLQLNEAFPKRSKISDGGIGDANHASRNSDHNPYIIDPKDNKGVVRARDFTHDPKTGVDCNWLAKELVRHKDPRIRYIIWNKQICSATQSPWKWRKYSGANAHTKHLHLSVVEDLKLALDPKPWKLNFPADVEEADDVARVTTTGDSQPVEAHSGPVSDLPGENDAEGQLIPSDASEASNGPNGASVSQQADVITNVTPASTETDKKVEAATNLPDTHIQATEKTNFLKKFWAFIMAVVTGAIAIPEWIQGGLGRVFTGETVGRIFGLLYDLRYWIIGALTVWFVVTKFESIFLKKKAIEINTDPEKGNVVLTKPPAPSLWQRVKSIFGK